MLPRRPKDMGTHQRRPDVYIPQRRATFMGHSAQQPNSSGSGKRPACSTRHSRGRLTSSTTSSTATCRWIPTSPATARCTSGRHRRIVDQRDYFIRQVAKMGSGGQDARRDLGVEVPARFAHYQPGTTVGDPAVVLQSSRLTTRCKNRHKAQVTSHKAQVTSICESGLVLGALLFCSIRMHTFNANCMMRGQLHLGDAAEVHLGAGRLRGRRSAG